MMNTGLTGVPYTGGCDMNEPKALLLRRGDVLKWTGIPASEFKKLVQAGIVRGRALRPGGRMFFAREHIRSVLMEAVQN